MERAAIATVEQWRANYLSGVVSGTLADRAELIRWILNNYRGNKKLRLEVICPALGCTMRSLQREFQARYGQTMHAFQEKKRLEAAIWYLLATPDIKLTALAAELGYDRESEFSRFFRRKTGLSPTAFLKKMSSEVDYQQRPNIDKQ